MANRPVARLSDRQAGPFMRIERKVEFFIAQPGAQFQSFIGTAVYNADTDRWDCTAPNLSFSFSFKASQLNFIN